MAENEVKGLAGYSAGNSEYNAMQFMIRQAIREQVNTCVICKVMATDGDYVDVLPLVTEVNGLGESIEPTPLFHLPFMRYHAGIAAVILNPVPGDLGLAVFSTRDNSGVTKGTTAPKPPASFRGNTMANGFYVGGFLNQSPSTFIEITQGGQVNITAPGGVNIAGNVTVSGDVVASGISLTSHVHGGVQGGGSTTAGPQ